MKFSASRNLSPEVLKYLAYFILLIGIALRICIYLQNRDLFLDEANVARNIYERHFLQLLQPLSYYQYAPPLFLWALKLVTNIGGYSEYAFRLVPLLCSIGSLGLLYVLLGRFGVKKVAWYPLFLFSTGLIYLRYASELKQYSSDCFIALALIWLALVIDIRETGKVRFLLLWVLIGSLAIWASMPSVFVLAAVGLYYFVLCYGDRNYTGMIVLVASVIIWLIQFMSYYLIILKPQIASDYLQNFHKLYFLYILPTNKSELWHNWDIISNILSVAGGHWALSLAFHITLIFFAAFIAMRDRKPEMSLLFVPIALVLFAACLHQFSLLPRVSLFMMPPILILVAIGFEYLFRYKYLQPLFIVIAFICLYNFNQLKLFYKPLAIEQITKSMGFLKEAAITGPRLYIHPASAPAYIYYTTIHPDKDRWISLRGGIYLDYNTNYDSLGRDMHDTTALLYSYEKPEIIQKNQDQINKYQKAIGHYSDVGTEAFLFTPIH